MQLDELLKRFLKLLVVFRHPLSKLLDRATMLRFQLVEIILCRVRRLVELAEKRAVGDSNAPRFNGTAFLASLKK